MHNFLFFRYAKILFSDYRRMNARLLYDEQNRGFSVIIIKQIAIFALSKRGLIFIKRKEKIMEKFEDLIQSQSPVLVDFFAEWCGPCKMISPILDELQAEFEDKINIIKVNVDNSKDIAEQYNITKIPALVLLKKVKKFKD